MNDILLKYSLLDKTAKREVLDFMDFLLSKKRTIKKKPSSDYKKKILTVSTWTETDLKIFDENQKQFDQWKVEKW